MAGLLISEKLSQTGVEWQGRRSKGNSRHMRIFIGSEPVPGNAQNRPTVSPRKKSPESRSTTASPNPSGNQSHRVVVSPEHYSTLVKEYDNEPLIST